jgi:hypothetical protein
MSKAGYFPKIEIGQGAIGGLPMTEAYLTFTINKVLRDGTKVDAFWSAIRFKDFKKWIDEIAKDHRSKKAIDGYRNLNALFAEVFCRMNKDLGFYDEPEQPKKILKRKKNNAMLL